MRIQLWSYNYAPEPLGIAPVSRVFARAMAERGHDVEVVAAHPHYPEPRWGWRARPYREVLEGISVLRLPLIPGRSSGARRMLQELSFAVSQSLAAPFLGKPDVIIAVSPSFPALLPAMQVSRVRRVPLVVWLKDILPDGAVATGYLSSDGFAFRLARHFELAAYRAADVVVVLSETFRKNLLAKGVPPEKLVRIYDPATRPVATKLRDEEQKGIPPRILCMGNIGRSQNLEAIVRAFERSDDLARLQAQFIITGTGVAEHEVRAAVRTDRVHLKGLLSDDELESELAAAQIGAVTQHYEGSEFNVPSKVMNYFGAGLPVLASVNPAGEVAHFLRSSNGGWVTPSADPTAFARKAANVLLDTSELRAKRIAAWRYAKENFTPEGLAERFETDVLERLPRQA